MRTTVPLAIPMAARAFRVTSRSNYAGSIQLAEVHLLAAADARPLEKVAHSWQNRTPASGEPAGFGMLLRTAPTDQIALLFVTVDQPRNPSPISNPQWEGALLLDPRNLVLLDSRYVSGTSEWRWAATFSYDPALAGASMDFQAMILGGPGLPQLFWSNPTRFVL